MSTKILLPLALAAAIAGCNGSTSPTYISLPSGSISATPSQLAFTTAGAQQSFTVNDPGNGGTLTAASTNCSGIATFTPTTGSGGAITVNVTSVAAGACAITVSDSHSRHVAVSVSVTTTGGHISSR